MNENRIDGTRYGGKNSHPGMNEKRPFDNRDKKARRANGARDTGDSENCESEGI